MPDARNHRDRSQFVVKLHAVLEAKQHYHDLHWVEGNTFEISADSDRAVVALTAWKYNNLSSFVRQLNYYGFARLSDRRRSSERGLKTAGYFVFQHPSGYFREGDSSKVHLIGRNARPKTSAKPKKGRKGASGSSAEPEDDESSPSPPPPAQKLSLEPLRAPVNFALPHHNHHYYNPGPLRRNSSRSDSTLFDYPDSLEQVYVQEELKSLEEGGLQLELGELASPITDDGYFEDDDASPSPPSFPSNAHNSATRLPLQYDAICDPTKIYCPRLTPENAQLQAKLAEFKWDGAQYYDSPHLQTPVSPLSSSFDEGSFPPSSPPSPTLNANLKVQGRHSRSGSVDSMSLYLNEEEL